jgi:hypothetical protein
MFSNRFFTLIFVAGVQFVALHSSAGAVVAPIALSPGAALSPLPKGGSSYPGDEGITLFDDSIDFDFDDGLLSGVLRERVSSTPR